ncbi:MULTISPECIES: helix-turn-helix transcriptional regulator [Brevibacterium]|uniref:HTH cro/C1-type domain-containing protein n=1 Tax=Brevibacterium antiquum CNRZ 918 TaxID=1255637 RepID=A0A2H1KDP5_9MICO|nr:MULTISPECIES: helix-turn-helix transcriptional regulator [Brevibacterium]SMX97664.1 hypothetical protein BANT918_02347 [Brevibacterium antiquum CNRZ 918]HCG55366.1 XRE family transcriptional regulator [Brevibacterium sp.]
MATKYEETRRGFTARPHKSQIRTLMKFQRWTNATLAIRASVSPSTIGNMLGSRNCCTPETAGKVAKALGVETEDLFTIERIRYAA